MTSEHFKKLEEPAPPLEELKSLVTGDYPYASLDELLYNVEVSYPCPIRHTQMEELRSKKEECHDTFLRFQEKSCPTFCNVKDYNYYYYGCREQGHSWFTLDYISRMVCGGGVTPTLSMSKSDKSYGKMYLRCPQRNCDLFQWLRFKTSEKTQQILCIDME